MLGLGGGFLNTRFFNDGLLLFGDDLGGGGGFCGLGDDGSGGGVFLLLANNYVGGLCRDGGVLLCRRCLLYDVDGLGGFVLGLLLGLVLRGGLLLGLVLLSLVLLSLVLLSLFLFVVAVGLLVVGRGGFAILLGFVGVEDGGPFLKESLAALAEVVLIIERDFALELEDALDNFVDLGILKSALVDISGKLRNLAYLDDLCREILPVLKRFQVLGHPRHFL